VGQADSGDQIVPEIDRLTFLSERCIYDSRTSRGSGIQGEYRQRRQEGVEVPSIA
jgi:hypothetical protein